MMARTDERLSSPSAKIEVRYTGKASAECDVSVVALSC